MEGIFYLFIEGIFKVLSTLTGFCCNPNFVKIVQINKRKSYTCNYYFGFNLFKFCKTF